MSSTQPEIVVGIDFGMTFTGVSYSNRNMPQPRVIQKWPGKLHETSRKVPSILHYPPLGGNPEWGFPCQYSEFKKEWFKRYLDPEFLDQLRAAEPDADLPSIIEVRKWYKDYMRCLYLYISRLLQDQVGSWESTRVEFLFSLPTTFRSQAISTSLRELLVQAGFSRDYHTIEFGLTEPQASAVDAAKDSSKTFESGEIMLVCDAGGATTDFALLEQISPQDGRPKLQELATIPGVDVGSTNIDVAFEELVETRLQAGEVAVTENTAWTMMHSPEFQEWKCSFGDPSNDEVPKFLVSVPQLDESVWNREAGIERGKMAFSHEDFRSLFDPQVNRIIALVRQQLNLMQKTHDNKYVNYLILSGGLGSSPYLLSRLREEFVQSTHFAAPSLEILVSYEPQLAVCRGLVIDRMQRIKTNKNILVGRVCPASYGVLCDLPYERNNTQHVGQETFKNPINGLLYVKNQVDWMIKKGDMIYVDNHVTHNFTRIVCRLKDEDAESKNNMIWKDKIVISHQEASRLPGNVAHADCHVLCNITSDLSSLTLNDLELVKGHKSWFKRITPREKYITAEHEIKVVIGPADIKFELWYEGSQYNRPNSIRVDWQKGAMVSAPNENRERSSDILLGIRKRKPIKSQKDKERVAHTLRKGLRSCYVSTELPLA